MKAREITVPVQDRDTAWRRRNSPCTARMHGPVIRRVERQVGDHPADAGADEGADAILHAHQGEGLQGITGRRWSCTPTRRTTRSSPTPTATSPTSTATSSRGATRASTGPSRWTAATRPPTGRACSAVDETPHLLNPKSGWLYNSNNWPWSAAGPSSPKREDYPAYVETRRGIGARAARHPRAAEQEGLHARLADRGGVRQLPAVVREADSGADQGVGRPAAERSAEGEAGGADRAAARVGFPLGRGLECRLRWPCSGARICARRAGGGSRGTWPTGEAVGHACRRRCCCNRWRRRRTSCRPISAPGRRRGATSTASSG